MTMRKAIWVGYKHMDRKHADAFENGKSIKLATFEHYRQLKFDRRDEMEGSVQYDIDHTMHPTANPGWQVMQRVIDEAEAATGMAVQMKDVTVLTNLSPAFLFCCSWEPDEKLIAQGQAVFEITDVRTFGKRLRRDNRRHLGRMQAGEVMYVPRRGNPFADEIPPQGPFFKDPKFAAENEIRLVFEAVTVPPPEPEIFIASPLAARLVRRIA